jgi:hypothetical protein
VIRDGRARRSSLTPREPRGRWPGVMHDQSRSAPGRFGQDGGKPGQLRITEPSVDLTRNQRIEGDHPVAGYLTYSSALTICRRHRRTQPGAVNAMGARASPGVIITSGQVPPSSLRQPGTDGQRRRHRPAGPLVRGGQRARQQSGPSALAPRKGFIRSCSYKHARSCQTISLISGGDSTPAGVMRP